MLDVIDKLPPKEALGLLSAAARNLLPRPFPEESIQSSANPTEVSQLLEYVAREVGVQDWKTSPEGQQKLLAYLSGKVSRLILPPDLKDSVASRLGEKGLLPSSLYHVVFPRNFGRSIETWKARESHIRHAIAHPDAVDHLLGDDSGRPESASVSLFAQTPEKAKFTWLIEAPRKGRVIHVEKTFRLFHDEINCHQARRPLDLLRDFLEIYGVAMFINGRTTKLIEQERVELAPGEHLTLFNGAIRLRADPNEPFAVDLALGYGLSHESYQASLVRHGVV